MSESPGLPSYNDLLKPVLEALVALGGSGSTQELLEATATTIGATQKQREATYASGAIIFPARVSWARTGLKSAGLIENPKIGVWVITEKGRQAITQDNNQIKQTVAQAYAESKSQGTNETSSQLPAEDVSVTTDAEMQAAEMTWSGLLLNRIQSLSPDAFERLCQRLLRENGFVEVKVTGKSGDEGIDGTGILRMNLISFHVLFQCKRWKGSVGSGVIRDFRGAMQGRADKGLIITTGTFTADALKEANRNGAPAIDLIDGEAIWSYLKEQKLGLRVELIEKVELNEDFFTTI